MFVEKLSDFRERLIQLRLLCRRNPRIGHRPIGNEAAQEQPFRETERLRSCEKQLLRFLDFLLPLNLDFVHKLNPESL